MAGAGSPTWGPETGHRMKPRCYSTKGQWLQRQRGDPYVRLAHEIAYRSRAAFKLMQIQEKFGILSRSSAVLDLGCAPGGWCQVAARQSMRVVGIDMLLMDPIPGVEFHQINFLKARESLNATTFNVIISDMAPNLTGIAAVDQAASADLMARVIDFARTPVLAPNGTLVMKLFNSPQLKETLSWLQKDFRSALLFKPDASRRDSAEIYAVARGKK